MSYKQRFKIIPAVYLVLRDGDKILLSKRFNTGYKDGEFSLIAGHLEGGELSSEAIIREAKEEANITINRDDLTFIHAVHRLNLNGDSERIDLYFEADKWVGDIDNLEPEKCSELSWFSIDNLPSNILPFVKIVLSKLYSNDHYSEFKVEPSDV